MKNNLKPFILTAILTLVLSIGLEAQTTYDLSSGKSLQVFNQLPDTLKPHFDEEFIAERLGNMEPAFDYRVGASAANNQIQLIIMIPDYTPEEPPKDAFGRPFKPGNRRLLPISVPQIYMLQLNRWYRNAWQSMPDDLKRAVNRYQLNFLSLFALLTPSHCRQSSFSSLPPPANAIVPAITTMTNINKIVFITPLFNVSRPVKNFFEILLIYFDGFYRFQRTGRKISRLFSS